ncbi:hypothetical protein G6M89_18900 [Natronolimnobius sp. AArcel1]|uniref:hypothetical protein n=1 Tax=Natronolimnobius sp. AArcel1 TaxID=1679093 RepID=UPI0013EA39D9|nr:hypothetical protein [Natronolimnobius sp. AArcel1]NGM71047.1 hypothetical protein [Natronolimnobius sp. AArcel1]
MWKDIFLDTVNEDFQTTVATPIDLSNHSSLPDDIPSTARVWGSNDGQQNRDIFESIDKGDYVFLYGVDKGRYVAGGIIQATCKTDLFAEDYWGEKSANRKLIYIISDLQQVDISVSEVNDVLGYEDIYHPHGLQRVADERQKRDAISKFGLEKPS